MLWNVLNDSALVGAEGHVPGDVRLVFQTPHLSAMWPDAGDYLIVNLHDCTIFEWHIFPTENETVVFQELSSIANSHPKIQSTTAMENTLLLSTTGSVAKQRGATHPLWVVQGEIRIECEEVSFALENDVPLTVDEVEQRASAYWSK